MKRCFLVTSLIQVGSSHLFKKSFSRTAFNTDERLRQTIAGLLNLHLADPAADIILIDGSADKFNDIALLPNVQYHRIIDIDPEVQKQVNEHTSKSHCEALMLKTFLAHSKITEKYDFITKISARYMLDTTFNTDCFTEENLNYFLFKLGIAHPVELLSVEFLNVMPKDLIMNQEIHGLFTNVYSVGSKQYALWQRMLDQVVADTAVSSRFYYVDVEYLFHLYLRRLNLLNTVRHVNWRIYGWGGSDGGFYIV